MTSTWAPGLTRLMKRCAFKIVVLPTLLGKGLHKIFLSQDRILNYMYYFVMVNFAGIIRTACGIKLHGSFSKEKGATPSSYQWQFAFLLL